MQRLFHSTYRTLGRFPLLQRQVQPNLSIFVVGKVEAEQPLIDSTSVKLPFEVPKNPLTLPATAEIKTTKGSLIIKFFRKETPISVANFAYLAKKNIYNGTFFHRYTPGFAIQGGDPTGTSKGGPGWNLPPEVRSGIKHQVGTIGWAMLPAEVNPERLSNGSQFYITLRSAPDLDRYYTVFAQVVRGLENLAKLRRGDKILSVVLDPQISAPSPSPTPLSPASLRPTPLASSIPGNFR